MSLLSQDLEACVLRTEDMLIGWTEFAIKYSHANFNLDVRAYRERLLSLFKKFNEVSQEVDKIVFCSVDKTSNLATKVPRSEFDTSISQLPLRPEYAELNLSADSTSSPSSNDTSQTNPAAQLNTPNVEIGDQRRNAEHLSPARLKNEARRLKSLESETRTAFEDIPVVDLTVDDSPSLFEIDDIFLSKNDDDIVKKSISSTSVEDTSHAAPVMNYLASATEESNLGQNSDRMPLSVQLDLSDEDDEDSPRFIKTQPEKQSETGVRYLNPSLSSAFSQPHFIRSPCAPTSNTQSLFIVSRSSQMRLSVPNRAPTNYKNKQNWFLKFADREKCTSTSKSFQRSSYCTPVILRKKPLSKRPQQILDERNLPAVSPCWKIRKNTEAYSKATSHSGNN